MVCQRNCVASSTFTFHRTVGGGEGHVALGDNDIDIAFITGKVVAARLVLAVVGDGDGGDAIGGGDYVLHRGGVGHRGAQGVACGQHLKASGSNGFGSPVTDFQNIAGQINLLSVVHLVHTHSLDIVLKVNICDSDDSIFIAGIVVNDTHVVGTVSQAVEGMGAGQQHAVHAVLDSTRLPAYLVRHGTAAVLHVKIAVVGVPAAAVGCQHLAHQRRGLGDDDIRFRNTFAMHLVVDNQVVCAGGKVVKAGHCIGFTLLNSDILFRPLVRITLLKTAGNGDLGVGVVGTVASAVGALHVQFEGGRDGQAQSHHLVTSVVAHRNID